MAENPLPKLITYDPVARWEDWQAGHDAREPELAALRAENERLRGEIEDAKGREGIVDQELVETMAERDDYMAQLADLREKAGTVCASVHAMAAWIVASEEHRYGSCRCGLCTAAVQASTDVAALERALEPPVNKEDQEHEMQ